MLPCRSVFARTRPRQLATETPSGAPAFAEADVRNPRPIPLGDRFVADQQPLGKLLLRISFKFTQQPDPATGDVLFHIAFPVAF
jgi:hypothetical protein